MWLASQLRSSNWYLVPGVVPSDLVVGMFITRAFFFDSLDRLMKKISQDNKAWVRNFEKPNTSPNSLGKLRPQHI